MYNREDYFALDIGTRSIIGIYGNVENGKAIVKNVSQHLHEKRTMFDGQVHDIEAVANVARKVKEEIEKEIGKELKNVAIAAAGRSLKTIKAITEIEFEEEIEISAKEVREIDSKGLEIAERQLKENEAESVNYYNVGHTIMTYSVDSMELKNPVGHKGKKLGLEIIATFLPKTVIDALSAVMKSLNLSISFLSLEPIVAIEVAVPENVRLLNIAMVDVGAGTSDVAITKDGLITGYAMTSTAGDEVTEAISQKYLLDFDTAEEVKCALNSVDKVEFKDIVGQTYTMESSEVLASVEESVDTVAKNIADAIIEANGKPTSAVFLVGGGCQVPTLKEKVAKNLELAPERVAIKTAATIDNVITSSAVLNGPDAITPVGILVSASKSDKDNFVSVYVNDENIRLFRSPRLKVADALLSSGFGAKSLIGKKGKSKLIDINGQKKVFQGEYGSEAKITVNSEEANIDSDIKNGDIISIIPAVEGEDAVVMLDEILDGYKVTINDLPYPICTNIKLNGISLSSTNIPLDNGDKLNFGIIETLVDLAEEYEFDKNAIYEVNTDRVSLNTMIRPGDVIRISERTAPIESNEPKREVRQINIDHSIPREKSSYSIVVYCNGKVIKMVNETGKFKFVDIFEYINFDRTTPRGKLIIRLNGERADFSKSLQDGDEIEIYWEK